MYPVDIGYPKSISMQIVKYIYPAKFRQFKIFHKFAAIIKMVRKILSILFLFVFLLNIIGFYPVFIIKQLKIKKDLQVLMKQTFLQKNKIILSFNQKDNAELKWMTKNEFLYDGNLYDVIERSTEASGIVHYSCINDGREKKLVTQLEKEIDRNIENHAKNLPLQKDLIKNLLKEYLQNKSTAHFLMVINDVTYNETRSFYASLAMEKLSPPPKST
jgi:hypothetical protein